MSSIFSCTLETLPDELVVPAAQLACEINPANAPLIPASSMGGDGCHSLGSLGDILTPQHLALMTQKYWGVKGVDLPVYFMDNPDADTRRMILQCANMWGENANVRFRESNSGAGAVRISRASGGYYSYLGTDILQIRQDVQNMNLEGFTARTSWKEYLRVVCHEFGHALGFAHEHMRREIVDRISPPDAYSYFGRTQGWSRKEVDQQVLTALEERSIRGTPNASIISIMCYGLPASIMRDRVAVPGGNIITDEDAEFIGKLYPKAAPVEPVTTTTPPPVVGTDGVFLRIVDGRLVSENR